MYSSRLLNHFENPRNVGELPEANARARVENPVCGDVLELAVKMSASRVSEIRFRAKGCVPTMACGSLITEMATGLTVAEAVLIRREDVINTIGGLPEASGHAAQLAIDALRAVLEQAHRNA